MRQLRRQLQEFNGEWAVDVIRLSLTGNRDDEWLRVSRWGFHVAACWQHPGSVENEQYVASLRQTLLAWGIGRRASRPWWPRTISERRWVVAIPGADAKGT